MVVDEWKAVWPTILDDLKKRRFIQVGIFAWTLLLVLAVTSPAFVLRWMGGKAWRRVHTLVYVAAMAGCIHYWWLVKKGVKAPMPFTLVLAVLLLARVVWSAKKRWRRPVATQLRARTRSKQGRGNSMRRNLIVSLGLISISMVPLPGAEPSGTGWGGSRGASRRWGPILRQGQSCDGEGTLHEERCDEGRGAGSADGARARGAATDRFTFGARPGDVDRVLAMGGDKWFEQQLNPDAIPNAALDRRLADFPTLNMTAEQALTVFPSRVTLQQVASGVRPMPTDPLLAAEYEVLEAKLNRRWTTVSRTRTEWWPAAATDAELAAQKRRDRQRQRGLRASCLRCPRTSGWLR